MITFENVIGVCWLIFFVYWFVSARGAKPTKERKLDINYIRFYIIPIIVIVVFILRRFNFVSTCEILWAGCYIGTLGQQVLSPIVGSIATILTISGLVIAILARRTLGDNWSANVELKENHKLVTKGIYGVVRHPIYLGMFMMTVGAVLVFQSITVFSIFGVVMIVFIIRMKKEEELITKAFPDEYPAYKKRTKALIPFIW
jgi:protein-S-isoprenylcysteine O-methyltransferase Ste14